MSLVLLENCFYTAKSVMLFLSLLNISLLVETTNGSQSNSLSSYQPNSKHGNDFNYFSAKFALIRSFQYFAIKLLNQDFSHA